MPICFQSIEKRVKKLQSVFIEKRDGIRHNILVVEGQIGQGG